MDEQEQMDPQRAEDAYRTLANAVAHLAVTFEGLSHGYMHRTDPIERARGGVYDAARVALQGALAKAAAVESAR